MSVLDPPAVYVNGRKLYDGRSLATWVEIVTDEAEPPPLAEGACSRCGDPGTKPYTVQVDGGPVLQVTFCRACARSLLGGAS